MSRRLALMASITGNLKLLNWRFTKYVYFLSSLPSKDGIDRRPAGISLSSLIACCGSTVMSAPVSSLALSSIECVEVGLVSLTFKDGAGGL